MKIIAIAAAVGSLLVPLATTTVGQNGERTSVDRRTSASARPTPKKPAVGGRVKAGQQKNRLSDAEAFEAAASATSLDDRFAALQNFIDDYPGSSRVGEARDMIAIAAAAAGDEKLAAGSLAEAITLYRIALESLADRPLPEKLTADSLVKSPNSLFWRGYRDEALQIARLLEPKVEKNAAHVATLATFYLGIENGADGLRLAQVAVALDPASAQAHQTLALAHRVNFQLEEAAAAFARAVELDPQSGSLKRGLAEMKRALGRAEEAAQLYRELVAASGDADVQSRTGLVLSLFDAGKRSDAETEMKAFLEQNPNNLILLAGAAYWYAAHGEADKAVEFARKAIALEPRYIWSHIALARGLAAQGRPVDAEETLLRARQYGRFPTLDYEIASARFRAGFFREAVEELEKSFSVSPDTGQVSAKLGGRIERAGQDFIELLAAERRASILQPSAADDSETASKMKALLALHARLKDASQRTEAATAADAFAAGDDPMRVHRQLYAASVLLEKKAAPEKALELAKAAIGNTDAALELPNASAAVLASELYESRMLAIRRDEFLRVPDVPRQTLSAILRGRVEEIAGWALLQQNETAESVVRLRRAVSVMPPKSAWWRSSMWRLGVALEANGNEKEALDSYIKSYSIDKPDIVRYTAIESLYKKINGSADGLEAKIGANPLAPVSASPTAPVARTETPAAAAAAAANPLPGAPAAAVTPRAVAPVRLPRALPIEIPTQRSAQPPAAEPAAQQQTTAAPVSSAPTTTPAASEPAAPAAAEPRPAAKPEQTPSAPPAADPPPAATPDTTASPLPSPSPEAEPSPAPPPPPAASPQPSPLVRLADDQPPAITNEPKPQSSPAAPRPTPEPVEPTTTEPTPAEPVPAPPPVQPQPTDERPDAATTAVSRARPPRVVITENIPAPKRDNAAAATAAVMKQLFEPILINVPAPAAANEPRQEKAEETNSSSATGSSPPSTPSENPARPVSASPNKPARPTERRAARVEITDTLTGEKVKVAGARPRVIAGKEVRRPDSPRPTPAPRCSISVSDTRLRLVANGDSLGVLVGISGGDLKEVSAASSSPNDVTVSKEPAIEGVRDRLLYVIRSISKRKGVFTVTFGAACGKREISVDVK